MPMRPPPKPRLPTSASQRTSFLKKLTGSSHGGSLSVNPALLPLPARTLPGHGCKYYILLHVIICNRRPLHFPFPLHIITGLLHGRGGLLPVPSRGGPGAAAHLRPGPKAVQASQRGRRRRLAPTLPRRPLLPAGTPPRGRPCCSAGYLWPWLGTPACWAASARAQTGSLFGLPSGGRRALAARVTGP